MVRIDVIGCFPQRLLQSEQIDGQYRSPLFETFRGMFSSLAGDFGPTRNALNSDYRPRPFQSNFDVDEDVGSLAARAHYPCFDSRILTYVSRLSSRRSFRNSPQTLFGSAEADSKNLRILPPISARFVR